MTKILSLNRFQEIISKFNDVSPILVFGDVGIDKYTYGDVKRISPEAPVPVLEVTKEWLKLGLAANISHNLKTLGVDSTLCGVVGSDLHADRFETLLEDEDLKTWGIVRTNKKPTIYKERITTNVQQICRIDYEKTGLIDEETQRKLIARADEFMDSHSCVIIEDYAKGTLSEELIHKLITEAKKKGKIVAVDPGKQTPPMFYKGASLLKPNYSESCAMVKALGYNETEVEKIIEILVDKLELDKIVVTLGAKGMALMDRAVHKTPLIIPTVANEVFDVSGAGDTAHSALTLALLSGASLEEAAWVANCASGVVVGKKGTATVNLAELYQFFEVVHKKLKG